jgi:hypothetical protein
LQIRVHQKGLKWGKIDIFRHFKFINFVEKSKNNTSHGSFSKKFGTLIEEKGLYRMPLKFIPIGHCFQGEPHGHLFVLYF